jgi:hypothetical protein
MNDNIPPEDCILSQNESTSATGWLRKSNFSDSECELSLDPEVAILFGREIGQSNGDILLTI